MLKISELTDEDLSKIPQLDTRFSLAELRNAPWEAHSAQNTHAPFFSASINGITVYACLFPLAIGSPNASTRYEVAWIASERKACDYLPISRP